MAALQQRDVDMARIVPHRLPREPLGVAGELPTTRRAIVDQSRSDITRSSGAAATARRITRPRLPDSLSPSSRILVCMVRARARQSRPATVPATRRGLWCFIARPGP